MVVKFNCSLSVLLHRLKLLLCCVNVYVLGVRYVNMNFYVLLFSVIPIRHFLNGVRQYKRQLSM